ncbi:MAG: HlyD family efflux transporter periplasmic adaptor subunit [Bacteroidales bacterium]|nr:HlyD family efflux transporter periplasmic adaptor subunit [Bacteroidales bacterium]
MNFRMKYLFPIISGLLLFVSCNRNKDQADAYGVFEATEIIVSAENNGKLLVFNVEEGGVYKKGEELGIIDTLQLYLQIQQLESSIRAALARRPDMPTQTRSLQEKLTTLEKERIRIANLVKFNAIQAKQLDDVDAEILITKSQIAATKSNLNMQSQSVLEEVEAMRWQKMQLEDALAKCKIKAPITGVVLKKYIEANELVFQGKPLFKMANLENMFIRVYVSEDMLSNLKYGQKADVFMDSPEGTEKKFEGEITWISPKAEFTPKMIQTKKERVNLVYAVKIMFENDGSAKIGMPGDVVFK